jgi:uncharacterized protein (DUF302 family)
VTALRNFREIEMRKLVAVMVLVLAFALPGRAATPEGMVEIQTKLGFDALVSRLKEAIGANGMLLVSEASASKGAAGRGITIPGNAVLQVFRNDYAVRMLHASVEAGFEAPIRYYVTEGADHTARLGYRTPSSVFAPYGPNPELKALAEELDGVFRKIAEEATRS